MTRHHTSAAGARGSNVKTAVGAVITVVLAAIGGTAYLLTQGNHSTPTPSQTTPADTRPARPETGPTEPAAKPPTGPATPTSGGEKSTKPKPPPPDPG